VTVEFALVCTLFFFIVFGLIEFSRISIVRHAIDNAAYEGARVGIIPGANESEVAAAAQAHLDAVRLTGATINVTPSPLTESADDVTVEVIVPVAANSWGVSNFGLGLNLRASATLGTERYRGFGPPAPSP
jgi:Flp pilus assembly protein TadG